MKSTGSTPGQASLSEAIVFGAQQHLLGVYQPAAVRSVCKDLAVVLLTPGMLHSAGPFRLHVRLADGLAASGIASLRFDLSGIGESLAVGTAGSSLDRATAEISAAIDELHQRYGVKRVAVFGLCSGADDALYAATRDSRIIGLFALDGCGYRTRSYFWHRFRQHHLPKMLRLNKWWQLLRSALRLRASVPGTLQLGDDVREFPSRDAAAEQLLQLAERDVRLHFHYTGGVGEYYSYANQFADMFPELGDCRQITTSFDPASDHVGFLCEHREALMARAITFFNDLSHQAEKADREQLANEAESSKQDATALANDPALDKQPAGDAIAPTATFPTLSSSPVPTLNTTDCMHN